MNKNQEHSPSSPEVEPQLKDLAEAGKERLDELRQELEKQPDNHEANADEARHEALEQASTQEKDKNRAEADKEASPAERRSRPPAGKNQRQESFKATMSEAQDHMSAPSRGFSKLIHIPAVEKVSDMTASTIARPNAILSGAVFAFVLTLAVYLLAKNYGYPLSGFESLAAFILGWIIGLMYDFFKVMITGRKDV